MSIDQDTAVRGHKDTAFEKVTKRLFVSLHTGLFRLSGGKFGTAAPDREFLLLTTRGRVSGQERTTPLFFFPDRGRFIVIASNWGSAQHPQWWLNLQADPHARIQIKQQQIGVVASQAEGEEYTRIWAALTEKHTEFLTYQEGTTRAIPVVILTPDDPAKEE